NAASSKLPSLMRPVSLGAEAASIPQLAPFIGQTVMPIATPLGFSGIDPSVMQLYAGQFQSLGLAPVAASIAGSSSTEPMAVSTPDTLTPGKTISVELVRGDLKLAASGTVTWRDGNKIY